VPEFLRWDVGRARHYDHGMLLFSTVTVALAIFAMGMIWIQTGWADGAGAVALGAISCCFFAALDEPAPMIQSFFNWNVVCLLISMVMLFAVLPVAHDFEMLVLMFAVPYLIIGLLVAQPRLAMIGMPLAVVTANDIGIQGVQRELPGVLQQQPGGHRRDRLRAGLDAGGAAVRHRAATRRLVRPAGATLPRTRWAASRVSFDAARPHA
jgi:uncharacterized membrane protein YccC